MGYLNCATTLPDFTDAFDYCAPNFVFGEIEEIIVCQLYDEDGSPLPVGFDWTDKADFEALFTAVAPDLPLGHRIPVRGTIDEPERPVVESSLYRKAYPPKRYTLTGSVDDLSQIAYDAMGELDNNRVRLWFIQGDYMYGLPEGLECDITTWVTIEEGEDSMTKYAFSAAWRGQAPKRIANPFTVTTP